MSTHERKVNDPASLPMQTRLAPISTIDVEARTAQVVFTTGAAVRRMRWTGWDSAVPFDEILVVSRDAINLDRLNAGAPALDSHSMWTTYAQVGVVERAWIDGAEGLALIRFPTKDTDEAADRMFSLVSQKIIRNVSVGYIADKVRIEQPAGEVEKRILERWTPHEISFVTVPADAGAQVRSAEQLALYPLAIERIAPVPAPATEPREALLARMRMRQRALR
jgi:phage head maturation protease